MLLGLSALLAAFSLQSIFVEILVINEPIAAILIKYIVAHGHMA